MSEKKASIFLRKSAQGDLILEIKPENFSVRGVLKAAVKLVLSSLITITFPIFAFLDALASRKKLVISSIGLGVGLGLSVLITQRPDALQAFPDLATESTVEIRAARVVIPSIDLSTSVTTGSLQDLLKNSTIDTLIHDDRSAAVGSSGPVVIADVGVTNILENLEQVTIGDVVEVKGTNNATYNYRVTEIRDMKAEYLPNVVGAYQNVLILYKANNLFRTQLHIVIASPVK